MGSRHGNSLLQKCRERGPNTAMNSRKGSGGKAPLAGSSANNSLPKGKGTVPHYGHSSGGFDYGNNSPKVGTEMNKDTAEDDTWEVYGKKNRNRTGNGGAAKQQQGGSTATTKAWANQEMPQKQIATDGGAGRASGNSWHAQSVDKQAGRGTTRTQPPSSRGWESDYMAPPPTIPPPLQHGWAWAARSGQSKASEDTGKRAAVSPDNDYDPNDASDDREPDTDDDLLSDDYDSDASQKSHETRKQHKWFKAFFEALDGLTVEQINETSRQWHCPACHDGPGAIDWYRGLQPLMTHARTKGSTRVKLHRDLAELLDEELQRRGTSVIPSGEAFGKWKGLRSTATDHEIVWPPMVVIMNTILEQGEDDKWKGMGNQELVDYFSSYAAVKARHAYGPLGHRGMSVLIFDSTAVGYLEAERLHKHFVEQGTDRDAWERRRVLFYPGGQRQLYGYMARKEDMEEFNRHSHGKQGLKFEMRSYQEMVVSQMKQMSEDNQQLSYLKNKVIRQKQHSKVLEETMGMMSNQLRIANEENRIVRQRTKIQHEENKEEMDNMEQFFKEKMAGLNETLEEKERVFEQLLQEERQKATQSNANTENNEEHQRREEEIARFIDIQSKGIEEFEAEREMLIRTHEDKKTELKRKHLEEELALEKEFKDALTLLMEKHAPSSSEPSAGA